MAEPRALHVRGSLEGSRGPQASRATMGSRSGGLSFAIGVATVAIGLSWPSFAFADPPEPVVPAPTLASAPATEDKLEVSLGAGTEECPDAEFIRARFDEALAPALRSSTLRPRITIDREGDDYVARVTVEDRVRALRSPDCRELASSAAFIAALTCTAVSREAPVAPAEAPAMAAESPLAPPQPTTSSGAGERARGAARPLVHAPVAPRRERLLELTAAALVGGGYVPDVWPGIALGAAFRRSWWSIGGEARLYPRKGSDLAWSGGDAVVQVTAILTSTVACLRWSPVRSLGLEGCSTFAIGMDVIEIEGLPVSQTSAVPVVYVGGRSAVELRPFPALSFALSATAEGGAVTASSFFFDGLALSTAWEGPRLAGAGAFETRVHF